MATAQLGRGIDCSDETGSTGHPQERQHSAAVFLAGRGTECPRRGARTLLELVDCLRNEAFT